MRHLFIGLSKVEAGLLVGCCITAIASAWHIGVTFYDEHSLSVPAEGGTFIEGVTGEYRSFSPLLAQTDIDRDITNVIHCGLKKFDPVKNEVVDDAATHTLSSDKKTYTFTLRSGVTWHDGTPVTADDALFTYATIQREDFPDRALSADFAGVKLEKIDEVSFRMVLPKPYAFFIYGTTLGLLPKHLAESDPIGYLQNADVWLNAPVGCGPYMLTENSGTQLRLTAFEQYFMGAPKIQTVLFRIFPSEDMVVKNISGVTGTGALPPQSVPVLKKDDRLQLTEFSLPQYVALFYNTEHGKLAGRQTRLGLSLAVDKAQIAESVGGEVRVIDTPFLEIDSGDWQNAFDEGRADGALFDAGWKYPAKQVAVPVKAAVPAGVTEQVAELSFLTSPTKSPVYATDAGEFTLSGVVPAGTTEVWVNGYKLSGFKGGTAFSYKASKSIGTLKEGEQQYTVEAVSAAEKKTLGVLTVLASGDAAAREKWLAEKTAALPKVTVPAAPVVAAAPAVKQNPALRYNAKGEVLSVSVLAPAFREEYVTAARAIVDQWKKRGVEATLVTLPRTEFFEALAKREYDAVLFGQNLGYNLDTYSFWHSGAAGDLGGNLSNLKSSAVNGYLEAVRTSFDTAERRRHLAALRDALTLERPALFLYTPNLAYAIDKNVKGFTLGRIALKRDRFARIAEWYVSEEKELKEDVGVGTFVRWLGGKAVDF